MTKINFKNTGISPLIKDYLSQKEGLKPFYSLFPNEENYPIQAKKKLSEYQHRSVLNSVLHDQMQQHVLTEKQKENLNLIKEKQTVTITTGHQLNLMTGPLYFIYKIMHVIKICDTLNKNQQEITYVPIYWMATEDHDFDEINHFNDYQKTYSFDAENGGFVGDISTENTEPTLREFLQTFGDNKFESRLKEII